jgi:hypothetical protein
LWAEMGTKAFSVAQSRLSTFLDRKQTTIHRNSGATVKQRRVAMPSSPTPNNGEYPTGALNQMASPRRLHPNAIASVAPAHCAGGRL